MECSIVKNFFEMLGLILCDQKTPKDYGTGDMLYHSEVDLLETIQRNPESNVSKLSEICGVTKSAITQMTGKLIEKNLLEKYNQPGNKKEKLFMLTEKGILIQKGHEDYHEKSNKEIQDYLCALGPEEKQIVNDFIDKVKDCVPFCIFKCNCEGGCGCED